MRPAAVSSLPLAWLLLACLLPACGRTGEATSSTPPALAGHLPAKRVPPGWKESSRSTYDPSTLYDYIDGGAERFLKRGFRRLHAARYTNAANDEVTVDLYDMGIPENAAALFAETRLPAPRPMQLCDAALGHDYGLALRIGRVYGEIAVPKADPALRATAESFARALCGK